ncbi:hypothetical protein J3A83DRAFT_4411168 [Scleroderma citrinum]
MRLRRLRECEQMPSLLGPPSMLSQIDVDPCTTAAVFTLVLYDYILTVSREIELFWRRPKRSWAFVFFVANRYITILGQIIQVIYTFLSPTIRSYYTRCDSLLLMIQVVMFVVQLIGGAIMTMRVYALYHNSRPVLIFLLALMFVASIIGCWAIFSNGFTPSGLTVLSVPQLQSTGGVGCSSGAYLSSEQAVYMAAAWSGQLAFDVVVFLLTLVRSLRIRKEGSRSIVDILLRDGSLYFAVMCGANVVNIIVLLIATNSVKAVACTFVNVISSTLVSRLMLNLRDPGVTDLTSLALYSLSHANMVFTMPLTGSATGANAGVIA